MLGGTPYEGRDLIICLLPGSGLCAKPSKWEALHKWCWNEHMGAGRHGGHDHKRADSSVCWNRGSKQRRQKAG